MLYSFFIIVLFCFWYLNKKSKNNYFFKNEKEIRNDFELIKVLFKNFEFSLVDEMQYSIAMEYFILNPKKYNGTSVINDRWMIKGLEPESVIHDYDDIVAKSLMDLLRSNYRYCNRLRKRNANWLWVWGFIFIGLNTVSLFKSIKFIFL